ncbi:MAG: hypothetical protein K6F02_05190 [Prevotella sp.]|nr:hypothetical protein [Prevotella sp.]
MEQKAEISTTRKRLFHQMMVMIFMCFLLSIGTNAQIVLHDATDVTQTKATLSADFPDLSATHGFQYKYGTLPELDDFSRLALAELSDPVLLTTTGNPWSARTVKGWVESKSGLSAGQSSVMSATVTFSEQTDISFEWSVDSEDGIGVLSFIVDGSTVNSISGEVGFTMVTYTASAGAHTFQWQYKKSAVTNVGLDIGMVRNVNFQNTTEGEWKTYSVVNPNGINPSAHPMLFPGKDYVFRAFQYTFGNREYSSIKHFRTLPVSIGTACLASITQSTATIVCSAALGDADKLSKCSVVTNAKILSSLSQFDSALLTPDSDPIDLSHSNSLGISSYHYSPSDTYYSDRGIWINHGNGNYVQADFTLYKSANVSFTYSARYSCNFAFYIDGVKIEELYNTSKTVSKLLESGKHTIIWKYSSYASEGTARLYDLKITGVDVSKLQNYDISYNPQLRTDTISIEAVNPLTYTVMGLPTVSKSNATFLVEISLNGQNEILKSNCIGFETLPVNAYILEADKIKQASATIRGKIDGGDASIYAVGLQYKDATGTRWTDYPKEVTDTLLTHYVTRLRPNTTYNYRSYIRAEYTDSSAWQQHHVVARVLCDTVFSEIGTFTTLAVEARKPEIVNRTQHTAELQGKVIFGDASIYQRGMQFRKAGSEEWEEVEDGGNDSIYTLKKSGLEMKTGYQARTYIQPAGSDIIYSEILDFRTKSVEVYIDSITNIYQRNVTVHGRIDCTDEPLSGGRISVYRMIGGQISDLVKTVAIPISDSLFVQKVTGLQPNTSYCFIAELDYGDGQKAYSNIHESEVTEIDAYKKALLAPGSSTDIEITYAENWEATDEGLYFDHYAWYDDLTATFTLTKTATISFDWSVVRSYAYNGSTSPDIKLFVDGSSTALRSIAATANNKTFSDHVTLTLNAGKHTLTWRPNYTGNFYVKNLMIPTDATAGNSSGSATITTRDFFKYETVFATDITQTKAFLIATLEETDENVEGYEFRYNVTDVLNLYQGENDQRVVTMPVERGFNGNLSLQLSGLYPAQSYWCAAMAKIEGKLFASHMKVFETKAVTPHAVFNSITQTGVWMNDFHMEAGDAEVQNLQYYVPGSNMNGYHDIDEHESLTASGLNPDTNCEVLLRWTVSDKEYSHSWQFKTKATTVTCSTVETAQTSAVVRVTPKYGTTTHINSGFIFANDSVVNVPLGETVRLTELNPNTSYTVRPFLETVEGGMVYGNTVTFRTKAISTTTKSASNISNRSATINGTIDCDGYSSAEFGFQWKQMEGWNSDPAFTKGIKNEDGSISVALVNGMLEPNTDYQYRTAVRYKGQIYYANNWETFRTESEFVYYPASVYTVFRTDRENNCLILCGYYIAGSETVTSQGYEYWSNQSSTRLSGFTSAPANNVVTITTDESMQYSLDMATLANGNYSVRAFVVTSSGIKTYGETLTFGVQNGTNAIEEIEGHSVSISTSGTTVTVHNATSLVCSIYSVNGSCVMQRKLMDNKEVIDLNKHNIYIVRLSNGMSYKIKL